MKGILFVFATLVSTIWTSAQVDLRYKLQLGDVFIVEQKATQEIIQELPDRKQIINNDVTGILFFNVIENKDDLYTIEISFKRFALNMSSPTLGQMMSVDTDIPSEDVELKMFLGMLDKPMQMLMKPTGEIIDIRNGEVIVNGMLDALGDLDAETRELMKLQIEKEWKAEVLAKSFEQMTFIYPEKEKSIGETWTNSYAGEGKVQAENVWTYDSVEKMNHNLSADAQITMNLSTDAISMMLSGTQTTKASVLKDTGFIKLLSVESKATGNATVPQAPNMTIPTTINSTTTYTLQ